MLPDRVSNPEPLTYESGALTIALRGLAGYSRKNLVPKRQILSLQDKHQFTASSKQENKDSCGF